MLHASRSYGFSSNFFSAFFTFSGIYSAAACIHTNTRDKGDYDVEWAVVMVVLWWRYRDQQVQNEGVGQLLIDGTISSWLYGSIMSKSLYYENCILSLSLHIVCTAVSFYTIYFALSWACIFYILLSVKEAWYLAAATQEVTSLWSMEYIHRYLTLTWGD